MTLTRPFSIHESRKGKDSDFFSDPASPSNRVVQMWLSGHVLHAICWCLSLQLLSFQAALVGGVDWRLGDWTPWLL